MIEASIGFVNGLGIFDYDYYATQNNTYVNYEVQDLEQYQNIAESPGILDYVSLAANLVWEGLFMVMRIFFAIVLIFGDIVTIFEVPAGVAALIQVGVYIVYYMGWAEYKSGKSFEGYS